MTDASDIIIFIGRFHPLVVHLPIGFIIIASLMELLSRFQTPKYSGLDKAISISIFSGAVGGALAAVVGYLLSTAGGYDENTLFWHQWLGILFSALSLLCWALKTKHIILAFIPYKAVLIALIVLISITGHLGGNLTHGSNYLTAYAPKFVKTALGNSDDGLYVEIPKIVDSIVVFDHLIQPVLNAKCVVCHNANKSNGNLRLDSKEMIRKGGNGGVVVVAGKVLDSPLFGRTILPQQNVKFMPPSGTSLSFSELKLLEWWIQEGASFENKLLAYEVPETIKYLLLRDFGIDTQQKPYYETLSVEIPSENALLALKNAGWRASFLSTELNILDISFRGSVLTMEKISVLEKVSSQITWLDLSKTTIDNEMLQTVSKLKNLTRLNLSNSSITDDGVAYLSTLKHLEVLNLYGTKISDSSVKSLESLTGLKRLYLWQTNVSPMAAASLQDKLIGVKVVGVE